jgi:hypothetical protein
MCGAAVFLAAATLRFDADFFASDLATSWAWLDENLRAITGFSGGAG